MLTKDTIIQCTLRRVHGIIIKLFKPTHKLEISKYQYRKQLKRELTKPYGETLTKI